MSDRGVLVASTNFCHLHLCSKYWGDTSEEKETWKSAKKNIPTKKKLERTSFIPWIRGSEEHNEMV